MKSLGDDSLPIDVTRDERMDSNRVVSSMDNNVLPPQHFEDSISPEHITQNYMEYITKCSINEHTGHEKYPIQVGFLVSFLVDARGGAMRGCRHSGVRVIVPPRCAPSPTRITCRYVRPQRTPHPPPLMEGEALASRVLELGPTGVKFLGPVIIEVPHFAALRNKEREIVILRSDNGESWKEHSVEATEDILHEVLRNNFEADDLNELEDTSSGRITRIVTQDFPQYFAVVSRVRQEVHAIGPEGGMVSSTVVPQVQAVFPEGALTKKIKVGLQAQPIDPELSAKLLGHGVAVSPVVTVEPRRRKFHKAITLTMPAPKAHSQGMINQYSGSAPTLRLLCSITGGTTRAQWEDVTGSTPLTFVNDCVSFTTTVSARFWLMDCRNISDATKMATELYKEAIHVPFMAKFVVFAKRVDPLEARLRVFCMTDDKEDKTLEQQEQFTEVAKSRDVEVLEGKQHYIEFAGNLVPITKSGEQLSFCFRAFKENRLPFSVRIKDQHAEAVSRCLFMKEPKVPKGEPPQQPICILNIVLPDDIVSDTVSLVDSDSYKKHSNISENYYYYRQDPRMADMSNLLGEDWISLANQLGLTATEMNVIKSEYPDSTAKQAQSMLRMWLSQSSKKDQMNTLENALWRIGRGDIVSQCLNDEGLEIIPRTKKEISPAYRPKKEDYERDNNETKVPTKATLEDQEGGKRNNIRDKYLAEEKEQWEEEEEEEPFDKPVAERRKKIQKRLSAERTIPASSQRREIVQEITTIKQQSLVEDKLAEVQQKVIEHEEKSKTVLSKTTTTKNDQTASSNNKEPILLGDERKMAEIAHKTAQDKVFMEGITERLNKKDLVTKHISVEDGQKSPKFSKTPPPSPADFLLKEQTYTSQETELARRDQIKAGEVNTNETCQLTDELTATNTEQPLPKPRPSKLPEVGQTTGLPDIEPEKPLSPVRDDLLDREDVPETYNDKRKFWENVSQEHSQKRLSFQEPTTEKNVPRTRISVPDFSNMPVPKPRTVLQTSQSLVEADSKSEGAASCSYAESKGAISKRTEDDMFLDRKIKPAKKKSSIETDHKGSGPISEGLGYISDSEDVENNISDSEIEDRVPQIRDRMMSVFVPSGSSACRVMRSASLPTEDLYEVSARTIKARKEYYEEQIRKEMIEEQLTSEIEEEHSPERKNLLSSTEEDRTEADAKSIGEDMEDIKEDIRSSTKSHTSKIPIREPKVIQDVEEKLEEKFGATKKLEVKTKHKEDTHKIERKVTPTTKVEKISITTESTDSKQKSRKTQEDQPTPITEGSQISAKDNERSMLESQLNLSSGRSGPLVEETNLIGGSHSVKPHPPEVLVDKSEIEGSEKLTDLDQDTENRSVDLSGTEIIGDTGTNKLKYGEIKLVTATKTGCEIDISEQAEEFILPEIVAERIDFSSKAQGIKDANRVNRDTKITHESSPGTIPKTDADKISREQQADEEKIVVVSSDKKGTSKKDMQNIDKTVVEIHQTRSTENKGKVKDRAEDDDKKEKPKELADVKTKDLDKTKPKPDTTKIKPSTEARPLIAEGQTNIEQLIYDCLQQQKVDSEEAHKIANALVGEIEAEIQKQDALDQPVEKITNLDDKKYIPENLKRLAEIKGLDAREIELVESVLERRQRSLKLTREDTQISSVEITDEDLKYSGGEFDYSQVLEQQVNQLKQESQSEILDETPDDVKSNAKSVDINSESTCKEKEWLRDNETIKGNKKTSVLESGTLKSTEAVSSEKLNMQDTTTFQIGDKEAKKVVDEKSKVVKSQAEVTIDEKTKVSTDESEITASNLDTTKVKSNHKTHILEDELKIKDKDNNIELIQAKAHNLNKDNIEIEHKLQQATTEITEDAVKRTEEKTEDKYNERSEQVEEVFRETSSKLEERDDGSTVKIHKEVDKVQSTTQNVVTKVYHEEKVSTSISQEVIKDKDKILGGMSENLDKHKTSFENQSEIFNAAQLPTETPASTTPAVVLRKSKSDADTSSGSSVAKVDRKSGYEYEVNSSSGESHYQSFEMESGKSRPCSSDIEGFVAVSSSEYESALTSQVYSARSQISSTDYQTPVSTLSSKESMKSLDSEGSDNLASVEVTEHSETLVPSTSDLEDMLDSADQQLLTDESEQNFNFGARCSEVPQVNEISDSEGFSYKNESIEVSDEESPEMKVAEVHSKMKRSYEMTFQPEPKVLTQESPQGEQDEKLRTSLDEGSIFSTSMSSTSSIGTQRTVIDCDRISTGTSEHVSLEELENAPKGNLENLTITTDMFTSTAEVNTGMLIESVTLTTSSVDINGVQSVCTQVTSDEHAVADEVTSLTFTEPKKKGHKRNESVLMGSKIILPAQFEEEKVSFETPKVSESITQEKTIEPLEKVVEKAVDKTNKLWKIDDEDILHEKYFAVKTGEFLESERAAAGDCYVINKFHDAKPEKLENVPEEPSPSPRQSAYVPHFDTPQPLDEVSQSAEQINQSDSTKKEIVATIVTKEQQNLEKSLPQNESIHKFLEKEREISERYHVLEQVANKKAAKLTEGKPVDTTNKTVASNQISSSEISEFLEKERSLAEKYESPLAEIKQITKTKAQPSTSKPTPVVKKVDNHSIAEFLDKEREIGEEYKPTAQTIYIEQAKVKVSSEIPENKLISKESSTSAVKGNAVDVGAPVKISSPSISQFLEKEREALKQFKSAQESIYKENEFEKQAPTDRRVNKDKPHAEIIPDVDMQKFLDHEREACDVNKLVDSNKPKNDPFKKLNEKSIKEATTSSIAQEIYKKSDKIISNEFHKQPEGKVVFSKVPPCLSPAHKANQICPIMEDDISEKHELEKQETMKKKLEEKRKEIIEDYNVPDITVTQHMAPLVDNDFRYPDLELEAKEKLAGSQETPQTPASNSSKSSEETDIEQEYIVTEPVETISEEPEDRSPESKTEIKSVVETKTDEVLEKETDSLGSSESFEMLDKPDIIDDFVVIEEIGKEADELDAEGKSVKIAKVQKHKKKQDQEEDEERYLAHSAPTPLTTTKISDVKYFPEDDFEDSPPQVQGSKNGAYSTRDYIDRELEANRKWVEQQFQGDHASIMAAGYGYEMEFERGPLEDIKEEDITDFAASSYGSQKDSGGSLKESYSSTPEYDVLAGRKYFTRSGEHDDASMSSLQEFEKLEQAMSLEMRKLHQGSQDSSSNGSFKTKYVLSKGAHGSDISVSSLKEFEGLEKACIAAHTIEVQVKEEEALLDHIEEGQESIASESEGCETVSKNEKKLVTDTEEEGDYEKRMFEIDEIIKQAQTNVERFIDLKDIEQTESLGRGDSIEEVSKVPDLDLDAPLLKSTVKVQWKENGDVMLNSTDSLEAQVTKPPHHQSVDSLDQELIGAVKSSSSDSIEMEAKKFSKDSLDVHGSDKTYMVSSDSLETGAPMQSVDPNVMTSDSIDEDSSRFGIYDHSHSSTGRDLNSSAKEELSHERDGDNLVESRDNLDISSSTATHATYQYESDSVFSGSFTSGGSNTMVSSTNSIDQGKQVTAVDLEAAARQVWFEESEGKYLEDSKPYVTEIIEPCEDEFFTHTINRTVELPAEIRKVTITGPDADLKMKQFIQDFEEGEECVETQEVDADGNVHIRRVVKRRFVVKDDSGQLPTSEIEKYFKDLQPDSFKGKEFDSSAPSSSKISKVTRDVQEVSVSKGDQPAPSTKATRRRPLRYEISVEDQTEVDPREHDWRFNLPKHAEGEEDYTETEERKPSH